MNLSFTKFIFILLLLCASAAVGYASEYDFSVSGSVDEKQSDTAKVVPVLDDRQTVPDGSERACDTASGQKAFKEISLADCIIIALVKNYSLKESKETLISSEIDYYNSISSKLQARLEGESTLEKQTGQSSEYTFEASGILEYLSPDGGTFSLESASTNHSSYPNTGYSIGAKYRRPLAKGSGRITAWQDVRAAQRTWTKSEYNYFLSKQSLTYSIISYYLRMIYAKKQIEVNELFVESSTYNLKITSKKFDEGLVPKIDLSRAEVNLLNSKAALLTARNNWESYRDSLLILIGLDPRAAIIPVYDLPYSPSEFNEDECIELALELRKETKIDETNIESLRDSVEIAKNSFKPQIDFVANWNTKRTGGGKSGDVLYPSAQDSAWSAGIEYSIELNRTKLRTDIDEAERELVLGEDKLDQTKRDIIQEVRSAVRDLELAKNQIMLKEENLNSAKERLHLATRSWEEGIANNREMMDAQEDLVSAQISLVSAKVDYILYEYELRRMMGIDLANLIVGQPGNRPQEAEAEREENDEK